jgi:hypothetical protein
MKPVPVSSPGCGNKWITLNTAQYGNGWKNQLLRFEGEVWRSPEAVVFYAF